LVVFVFMAVSLAGLGVASGAEKAKVKTHHVMLTPDQIKWEPFPPLGPGVQRAILAGDPDKVGSLFVFRIKQQDGSKIPPHWHPVDENVTVISGTFLYGVGEKFDEKAAA
jgi:quercetin dioxygenase-like cupin family protein